MPENWEQIVFDIASQGGSEVEVRVALNCMSDDLWYRFMDEEPYFSGTIKKARLMCQNWWEKNGRLNLENKEFSYTGWYMNMKNRFGWADKQEVKQESFNVTISKEDADRLI